MEENDEDLAKLRGWFDKVSARDVLGASPWAEAEAALRVCAEALDGFADNVCRAEDQE